MDPRGVLRMAGSYDLRPLARVNYLVVHHSAVDIDSTARSVADYHIDIMGWPGIGYQFLIHWDGLIEYTGDIRRASYNVARRNPEVIGACLLGDWSHRAPPPPQLRSAGLLYRALRLELGRPIPIVGHGEIALAGFGTSCPGDTYYAGPAWQADLAA